MAERPRAAYRAVYLSAPLKFHSTLHAFAPRKLPWYHVEAWKKDPWAWEKHKYRTTKERKRGRWNYTHGPLSGVQLEGWPEPNLLGSGPLVQVAARAQAESLQDQTFWQQVAERTYKLRDVLSVGDVAVVLDALVTADHRHLLLLKTLAREIIEDADKMVLMEVAVVANAYAFFKVVSVPLLEALAKHVEHILSAKPPPYAPNGGDVEADPTSLSVLLKAFAALRFKDHQQGSSFYEVLGGAVADRADRLPFPVLVDVLVCFAQIKKPFPADPEFWATLEAKIPQSRMGSLCPGFKAVVQLNVKEPRLLEAFAKEILKGFKEAAAASSPPQSPPLGAALRLWEEEKTTVQGRIPMPTFALPRVPQEMLPWAERRALAEGGGVHLAEEEEGSTVLLEFPGDGSGGLATTSSSARGGLVPPGLGLLEQLEQEEDAPEEDRAGAEAALRRKRGSWWYGATSRCQMQPKFQAFSQFSASETFERYRRADRIGEALEGLNELQRRGQQQEPSEESSSMTAVQKKTRAGAEGGTLGPAEHFALAEAAIPILRASVQGLSTPQLLACAELYAALPTAVSSEVLRDVIQEAVRKLSNFTPGELKRLWVAAQSSGKSDPYLERGRRRRFPKALRKELRDEAERDGSV